MERRRGEVWSQEIKQVERGWCLGREEFRHELLTQGPGPSHFGEAAHVRAERLVVAGLKRLGWTEEDLGALRKGEPAKAGVSSKTALANHDAAGVDCVAAVSWQSRVSDVVAPAAGQEFVLEEPGM
jgi:hypothetical protein